jgi:hypothetical protein
MWLFFAIVGGFSAISLAHTNPPMALLYTLYGMTGIVMYIAMFQIAYGVTTKFDELRDNIRLGATSFSFQGDRTYFEMSLRSVLKLALKVGGYHTVERESFPIFVNYVVQQIVGLLVTF